MTTHTHGHEPRDCAIERDLFTHDEPLAPILDPSNDGRWAGWDVRMPHSFSSVGTTWVVNVTVGDRQIPRPM